MSSTAPFDIGTLIESTPGVYGGRPCLAGTRFPVLQVAVLHNEGASPEEIVARFEGLNLAGVYAGVAYYLANRAAIDLELEAETAEYDRLAGEEAASRMAARTA